MKKTALIFGITGQIGSYLTELLLEKGYEVHGIIRRSSTFNTSRINHLMDKITLHYGDVTDALAVNQIITQIKPDYLYNFSAQSHVKVSFEIPNYTGQVDGIGVLNILESCRINSPHTKIFQSSTSELFGGMDFNKNDQGSYDETCDFYPRSPYSIAKLYGYWIAKNYKESYNMFICNGILFNNTSPRRGGTFVEKKIVDSLVKIKKSIENKSKFKELQLGNLYSKRDIGYSKDYVEGIYLMLQQEQPDNYILATGDVYSIKEIVEIVLSYLKIDFYWVGEGIDEKCYLYNTNTVLVSINEKYFRPAEVDVLIGSAKKAKEKLNWTFKTKLPKLLEIMVDDEMNK